MTTRGQILRSSTPGQAPVAGTRQPGELWTTFPDLQLGVIDASKNAQRLIAVRFFSTTANYAAGDFIVQAGKLYFAKSAITAGAFNSTQWTQITVATDLSAYLPLTGGTLTGALVLAADPSANLQATTKQYVDGKFAVAGSGVFLPLAGGTLTGKLTLAGAPSAPLDAATKAYVDAGAFVPIGGGTMTGDLILNRDPQVALGAATKQSVDARGVGQNRIINGDMRIDQRNNGASGTTITYTIDRWAYGASIVGKGTWSRYAHGPGAIATTGCGYNLAFTSASAYAPLTADAFYFQQPVEADMAGDFAWGGAGAQPVTLSFWVISSLTGTFSGAIRNYPLPSTRSYPFSFNIPVANTYTKIVITIPGDTAGTWVLQGNAAALAVIFDLGSGATWRGPANAWAAGNFVGANGAQSVVATNGATYNITGVKLEVGSIATPFDRQSPAKTLNDCRRYYQQLGNGASNTVGIQGYAGAVGPLFSCTIGYQAMRAAPTAVAVGTFSSGNAGTINLYGGLQTMLLQVGPPAVGGFSYYNTGAASYIALTAEL